MNMSLAPVVFPSRRAPRRAPLILAPLALILAAGATGCFRATGVSRPTVAVEEIPASGGDRIQGLKATSGPGDFYLGNDAVQLAVDGAAFGDREGQFGAASGGAILDVGTISLDQSFKRVSMPTDLVERLGPVVNQDPDLPLVFDRYSPGTGVNSVNLEMQGYLLDPKGKLGVATDGQSRVSGVTVLHRIRLNQGETFFTLETTLSNNGTSALPIRSLGDFLSQRGGGFRLVVPAVSTFSGAPLSSWGAEIPGSDFTAPLTSSVVAPMVALVGAESAGSTLDSHASLGILPLDVDQVLVASDPQHALTELRPVFPGRLVVGSPAAASLPAGQTLTYRRRLYALGGPDVVLTSQGLAPHPFYPSQGTVVFNEMAQARSGLRGGDFGILAFDTFGTALRGGPIQTEFRFERYTGTNPAVDPATDADPSHWVLERVEWREPSDIPVSSPPLAILLPAVPDVRVAGQNQPYRITAANALQSHTLYLGTNILDANRPYLATPITPSKSQGWHLAESLTPERGEIVDASGNVTKQKQMVHGFSVRQAGTLEFAGLNPLRITFAGLGGVPDPHMQRIRRMASYYDQIYKGKVLLSANIAAYQYTAGNEVFGSAFSYPSGAAAAYFPAGDYLAYGTRGPLSYLDVLPVKSFDGQQDISHGFVALPSPLPTGWTSFDIPGPTQATTGGLNPGEMLSSALAEGVQVVTRTEEDVLTDPAALRSEFRAEIESLAVTDAQRAPIGADPFVVGGRSSRLSDGFVTALFTPSPTGDRNGGARPSKGWTLADFITQAEGGFTVVHRPRGPQGLFTVRGFDPAVALGSGANAWWAQTGPVSLGKRQGDFDALELIRAEGCDPADPSAWFAEFKAVRADWFSLLKQQGPGAFTKGLGLSSSRFSFDTPVGLARTYLKLGGSLGQTTLTPLVEALRNGAAVASTGPMLDVTVNGIGPGGLVSGPAATVNLSISLYAPDWVPVDEVRVVVNGVAQVIPMSSFTPSTTDFRLRTATVSGLAMPAGKDAWVVVEAGVPLATSGAYRAGTPWNRIMRGIYPVAVSNPVFVDVNGGGYTPPGL
ncbi:hypothetical protein GETHOR_12370 [Geothrix oryzae]|uniref:Uncharacterized protein n=2 Tax=Geothrix oryzae TaxID=2927975 RepID=A0ABM8DQA9_9BACT|nr:hypothetical protein GETHOR_12370 [Geothrix oryzae]